MAAYALRRLLLVACLLLIVSFVSFLAVDLMPGDFVTRLEASPEFSTETIERFRASFGLDRPVLERYGLWLKNLITRGDFGTSFETSRPVFESLFLGGRLGRTMLVSGTTILFMWLVAIPLGVYAATRSGRLGDEALTIAGFVILSIPGFLIGLVLMWLLVGVWHTGAYGLGVGGLLDREFIGAPLSWAKVGNLLWHLWPVWLVVGLGGAVGLMRVARGSLLDELGKTYVAAARAKGMTERRVFYRHAFRNAVNPLISILGMQLPRLVGGSLIASIVFGLQTVEGAFWMAIKDQDTYVILGGLLFFGLFLAVGNLAADLLLAWSDPRVRFD
jgi:peptide/nickel transport system permease protein